MSVHEGLNPPGQPPRAYVVAALSDTNLKNVAKELKALRPNSPIIIGADANSIQKAKDAAIEVGGRFMFPSFDQEARLDGKAPTDFNDLMSLMTTQGQNFGSEMQAVFSREVEPNKQGAEKRPDSQTALLQASSQRVRDSITQQLIETRRVLPETAKIYTEALHSPFIDTLVERYAVTPEEMYRLVGARIVGESVSAPTFKQKSSPLPKKLTIDGIERHTTNSDGKPIAQTEEGIKNFWAWFGDSQVVDNEGSWKDKTTGEKKEKTEWHRVVFFRALAEAVGEYLKKGSQIYVEGKMRTKKWTDKEGIERYTTELVAHHMQMLGKKTSGETAGASQGEEPPLKADDQPSFWGKQNGDIGDAIPF